MSQRLTWCLNHPRPCSSGHMDPEPHVVSQRPTSSFPYCIPAAKCTQRLARCVPVSDVLLSLPIPRSSGQIHSTHHTPCPSDRWIPSTFSHHIPAISRQSAPCRVPVTNLQPHPSHLASQQPSRSRTPRLVSSQPTCHSFYTRSCPSGHPHPKPSSHFSDYLASSSIPCYAPLNIPTPNPACRVLVTTHSLIQPTPIISPRRFQSDLPSAALSVP